MKKYVDNRNGILLCPFCSCRVLPYRGNPPLHRTHSQLLLANPPAAPVPMVQPFSFRMMRLTVDNWAFWDEYACAMRLIVLRSNFSQALKNGWAGAVKGFRDALNLFEQDQDSEVWIAYASHGEISTDRFVESAFRIEMCMTVTTHLDIPFTTHMGIFRTPLRRLSPVAFEDLRTVGMYKVRNVIAYLELNLLHLRATNNLSGQFHAFAAQRCQLVCRGVPKRYMITAPLRKMMEIMKTSFGIHATEKIELIGANLTVRDDAMDLGPDPLSRYKWLAQLIDLDGTRPKVAVDLAEMAARFEERARVESILNWLENWR